MLFMLKQQMKKLILVYVVLYVVWRIIGCFYVETTNEKVKVIFFKAALSWDRVEDRLPQVAFLRPDAKIKLLLCPIKVCQALKSGKKKNVLHSMPHHGLGLLLVYFKFLQCFISNKRQLWLIKLV